MKTRITDLMLAVALALASAPSMMARDTKPGPGVPPPRPEGPCDIYAAAGAACVAAHSTTLAAGGFYLLGLSASGLAVPVRAGDTTIHVRSTTGMSVGDTLTIDTGAAAETRKVVSVGQAITVGSGPNAETASVLSVSRNFGFGPGGPRRSGTFNLGAPLAHEHAAGAPVTGTGVTLTTALRRAHDSGAQVAASLPTPGAPNKYERTGKSR